MMTINTMNSDTVHISESNSHFENYFLITNPGTTKVAPDIHAKVYKWDAKLRSASSP